MYAGDVHPPQKRGNTYFYWKRDAGQEKLVLFAREASAESAPFWTRTSPVPTARPSPSLAPTFRRPGDTVAYKWNANNADRASLRVRDLTTGKDTGEEIPAIAAAQVAWVPPHQASITRRPPTRRQDHRGASALAGNPIPRPGTRISQDPLIRPKRGIIDVDESLRSPRTAIGWSSTSSTATPASDVYYRDLRDKKSTSGPPWPGQRRHSPCGGRQRSILHAHQRGRAAVSRGGRRPAAPWALDRGEPERANATLQDARVVGNHLVLQWLNDATSRLEVRDLRGGAPAKSPSGAWAAAWARSTSSPASPAIARPSCDSPPSPPRLRSSRFRRPPGKRSSSRRCPRRRRPRLRHRAGLLPLQGRHPHSHVHRAQMRRCRPTGSGLPFCMATVDSMCRRSGLPAGGAGMAREAEFTRR